MMTDRSKDNILLRGERLTAIDDDLRELAKYLFFFTRQRIGRWGKHLAWSVMNNAPEKAYRLHKHGGSFLLGSWGLPSRV